MRCFGQVRQVAGRGSDGKAGRIFFSRSWRYQRSAQSRREQASLFEESFARIDLQICRFGVAREQDHQRECRQDFCCSLHYAPPLKTGKTESKHGLTFHYFFVQFVTNRVAAEEAAVLPNRAAQAEAVAAAACSRVSVHCNAEAVAEAVACKSRRPNNRAAGVVAANDDVLKFRYIPSRLS